MPSKIQSLENIAVQLEHLKAQGRTIVHCHGVFDLLHIGHLRYFNAALELGDVLVVTLTEDQYVNKGPGRPAFTEELRAEAIANVECVSFVAINRWPTAVETIKLLKPNLYVKGPDYKDPSGDLTGNILLEAEAARSVGGDIAFTEEITFSSSRLLVDHSDIYSDEQRDYIRRLNEVSGLEDIHHKIEQLKHKRVLLIGETIIDEYVYCNAIGKSGKEPVMVVKRLNSEQFMGGILAIANHISPFCKEVIIHSYIGEDRAFETEITKSMPSNVRLKLISKNNSPTILKRRYIDEYSKARIVGVYDIEDGLLEEDNEQKLLNNLNEDIYDSDLVLVADYGHGLITPNVVQFIQEKAAFLAVNTQINSSNIGFHTISKYAKADFVCIHEGELRHDYRSRTRPKEELIENLFEKMKCKSIIITQGKQGITGYDQKTGMVKCPAFANRVIDRVGAGDSVLAITALCLTVDMPLESILMLGNLAGAQSVETVGNKRGIDKTQLLKSLKSLL
ncbi:MAG: PfkB family carbohydrate kinase [Myxococcota bacterium]